MASVVPKTDSVRITVLALFAKNSNPFDKAAVAPVAEFSSPNALVELFDSTANDRESVGTNFEKVASTVVEASLNASLIIVAVILPCLEKLIRSPRVTLPYVPSLVMYCATASIAVGMFSMTARNSSPSSLPLLNACESCNSELAASDASPPPIASILLTVSVIRKTSCWLLPCVLSAKSKRLYASTVFSIGVQLRLATSIRASIWSLVFLAL